MRHTQLFDSFLGTDEIGILLKHHEEASLCKRGMDGCRNPTMKLLDSYEHTYIFTKIKSHLT
jgi:hypothetical protein